MNSFSPATTPARRLGRRLELKICGVTSVDDLALLEREGVDYAGVWLRMPAGRYRLCETQFRRLTAIAGAVRCVAVTTVSDPDVIAAALEGSAVAAVQLHGFQLPSVVAAIRRRLPKEVELFKVLHFRRDACLEKVVLRQYLESGADAFLADSFQSRAQIGSTGTQIPREALLGLLDVVKPERLFVAGGLDVAQVRWLSRLEIRGVDVDTGARIGHCIDRERVSAIMRASRGGGDVGM